MNARLAPRTFARTNVRTRREPTAVIVRWARRLQKMASTVEVSCKLSRKPGLGVVISFHPQERSVNGVEKVKKLEAGGGKT